MEVSLPTSLEDKLSRLATREGRDRTTLIVEAVERMIDYDDWFVSEVEKGLLQVEKGQTFSHEEVGERIENYIASKRRA